VYIFCSPGLASHRRRPLSSNVRHHQTPIVALFTFSARTVAILVALFVSSAARAFTAPNVVVIEPNLVTSGQPTAAALAGLKAEGFEAVIYLASSSVSDAVKDEPALLSKQGIEFVHVPIPFGAPTEAHFEAVSAALARLKSKKVLVHCQVNMRASTMVFLHRVVRRKESPSAAYEAVTRVLSPQGPWKDMAQAILRKHGVEFELF
jgi:protein tyrosine phosphatase (PTP) superfamily phosphohydrolase (DUF442 family)